MELPWKGLWWWQTLISQIFGKQIHNLEKDCTNLPENSKVWKPGISFVTVTYFQIDDPVHTFISTFYSIFDFRTLQFFNVTHITENRGISWLIFRVQPWKRFKLEQIGYSNFVSPAMKINKNLESLIFSLSGVWSLGYVPFIYHRGATLYVEF